VGPPETDAHGRGHVVVTLRRPRARWAPTIVEGPLDFRLATDGIEVCAGEAELCERAGVSLATAVSQRQRAALAVFTKTLRSGLFPDAEINAELREHQPRVKARVALLGKAQTEGTLDTAFRWNPATFAWLPTPPEPFVRGRWNSSYRRRRRRRSPTSQPARRRCAPHSRCCKRR